MTYEALLASGRASWTIGERIRVYRTSTGLGGVVRDSEDGARATDAPDLRDYDIDHYVRVLREIFAERLSRALRPEDFAAVVADPDQPSLFASSLQTATPVLRRTN